MKEIKPITSFTVDHRYVVPGVYVSRVDGSITTYDLRTRKPNAGDYMDHSTMHSVEHLFATYVRNSALADRVIYFGPMGCQTGFYLLLDDVTREEAATLILDTLRLCANHVGPMFGESEIECGNFRSLSTEKAKAECQRFVEIIEKEGMRWDYPTA